MRVKKIFVFTIIFFFLVATSSLSPCLAQDEEALVTTIEIHPETLNLKSKGKWITCLVEAPDGYEVDDIVPKTVIISNVEGNVVNIEPVWWRIEDDEGGGMVLMLKYSRSELQNVITQYSLKGEVEITVTGTLIDDTPFIGSDTIKVKGTKK